MRERIIARFSSLILGISILSINSPAYPVYESALCSTSVAPPWPRGNDLTLPEPKMPCSFLEFLGYAPTFYEGNSKDSSVSPKLSDRWERKLVYMNMSNALKYFNNNHCDEAIKSYQTLLILYLRAHTNNKASFSLLILYLGMIHFNLGITYYKKREYNLAIDQYNVAESFFDASDSNHPYKEIIKIARIYAQYGAQTNSLRPCSGGS